MKFLRLKKSLEAKAVLGFLPFVFLLFTCALWAQPKDNAPYSRIGLGEPVDQSMSAAGFGGMTAAYADPLHINVLNPASYGWLSATTFEAGLYTEHSKLKFNDQSTSVWTGNLNYLALAFPMHNPLNDLLAKKKREFFWTMNLALLPNTVVGYNIQTEFVHPQVDTTLNVFQGTGGTNKLVWGNGFRYKNLSFGVNLNYLFGQLESERTVFFQDLEASYSDVFDDNIRVRGLILGGGLQYRYDFDKKGEDDAYYKGRSLVFGFSGTAGSKFTTKSTTLRIRDNSNYIPRQVDTLFSAVDEKGKGNLPAELAFGVMYQHTDKLRVGVEYKFQGWGDYENEAKPEVLFDSRRISAGVEFSPNASSYNNYLERIRYRAGFYHRTDPRLADLKQMAVTFGLGLPVILPRQQTSFVNLGFELGRFDTSNAINETFVKITLGFTLNDTSWFYKRKFG